MHKFAIFEKTSKFYWSTNRIIYSILFVGLAIMYLKKEVFHFENNIIDKIFQFILIITLIISLITMFMGLTQVKPLRGKLNGYLVFNENFIEIKEEIFMLENIKKIQISNEDYIGKRESPRGNFGPCLSNGTNNFIVIFLNSGLTKRFQYELCHSNDFQKIRSILIHYYSKEKIDFWELANILGEKSSSEIRDFKKEIEK